MTLHNNWRRVRLWDLSLAEARGAVEWWMDPANRHWVMKTRLGTLWDFRVKWGACWVRKRYALPD